MKLKIIIISLFLACTCTAYAQEFVFKAHNLDGKDRIDTLYQTYYNRVSFFAEGVNCDDIVLKADELDVAYPGHCQFIIKSYFAKNGYAWIRAFNRTKLIDSFRVFVTNNIPLPDVKIYGKETRSPLPVSLDSIVLEPYYHDLYNHDIKFTIQSFIADLGLPDQIAYYSEYNTGNTFSPTFRQNFSKVKYGGCFVRMRNVVIKDEDGNVYCIKEVQPTLFLQF